MFLNFYGSCSNLDLELFFGSCSNLDVELFFNYFFKKFIMENKITHTITKNPIINKILSENNLY